MRIWHIESKGIWLGAVSIVCTEDHQSAEYAIASFYVKWRKDNPGADPRPVTATELSCEPDAVHILWNGDY